MKKKGKMYFMPISRLLKRVLMICISLLFLLTGLNIAQAQENEQKNQVSLNLKNVSFEEIIWEIQKQTDLVFMYGEKDIKHLKNISVDAEKKEAKALLQQLLTNTNVEMQEVEGVIVFKKKTLKPKEEDIEKIAIQGKVVDKDGIPLPGATILENDTQNGVTTDGEGNFSLEVAGKNSILKVSYIGFETQFLNVGDKLEFKIVLKESATSLNEVVVVGYGTQRRAEVSSAISSVKTEDIEKNIVASTSFDRVLSGMIKGVKITQGSGQPGSGVDINVRGVTSPFSDSDNNPLFVIDGVPFQTNPAFTFRDETAFADVENPLLALNPNDIESIDVLKDASATAIYGSRGANGVIIVRTKKGQRNEKMNISLSMVSTIARPVNTLDYLNAEEWKAYNTEVFEQSVAFANSHPALSIFSIDSYSYMANLPIDWTALTMSFEGLNEDWLGDANTNWADEVYRDPAMTQQYNITVRGGSEKTSYMIGFGHTNQEGLLLSERFKQYNFRTAIDTRIKDLLNIGITANIGSSSNETGYTGINNDLNGLLNARPDLPAKDENGDFVRLPGKLYGFYDTYAANPLAQVTGHKIENKGLTLIGNLYAEAELIKNLRVRADASVSRFATDGNSFSPASIVLPITPAFGESQSDLATSNVVNSNFVTNLIANYNVKVKQHNVGAMFGISWDRNTTDRKYFWMTGFPDDEVLINITSASEVGAYSGTRIETGLNSIFTRLFYSYDERYFLTLNFRTDRSVKFGPGNQRAYFPSVAASWNIANESFMKNYDVVNNLRLRLGVGRTGSNNLGDFEYLQFFGVGFRDKGQYNGEQAIGLTGTLPNPDIKWSTTDEINIGLDFGFFENRIRGSFDVYKRKTTGALMAAPYPLESGASSYTANFADLTNKGFEFDIAGDVLQTNDLNVTLTFNISRNKNTLDKFNEGGLNNYLSRFYEIGREVNIIKGYIVEKIFQQEDTDEIAALNAAAPDGYYQRLGTAPGDYKYKDVSGPDGVPDGEITADDMVYLGSSQPDFFGGFSTIMNYKGFELSAYFNFSVGAEATIETDVSSIYPSPSGNVLKRLTDRWTPDNPHAKYPRAIIDDPNRNYLNSDRLIYNTSYLRLKSLQLKYNLPSAFTEKIGFTQASVFVSASNIWTLTNYPGIDPEAIGAASSVGSTDSRDPYPIAKSWSVGLNVKF